ncbi:MAG: sigma-70 family RNA polymerase sigma factor [Candidatus Sulfotelmatobacter sp.]
MISPPSRESAVGVLASRFDDDTRLVKECLRGEESAWSELVSKYKNLIFSIPIKYGFSQEEAGDVFQSVCLDLVNQLTSLREPRALAGWLIRVSHNKCFHHIKDKGRHGVQDDDPPELALPAEEIPENQLRELEREQLLRSALRALSARCQRLVEMLFFESPPRPYQEIAKSLTLATGSIGFIRARCLDKLRKKLDEIGFA